MPGPLSGLKVIECVGLGPAPFAGMMFADMGAEVIAINRINSVDLWSIDINRRGKKAIDLDLKDPKGQEIFYSLCKDADILIEGYRPGAMERLGLGPDKLLSINPKLVYGRMTGWGQTGPRAHQAGHDLNYISETGALFAIGDKDGAPPVPLNLIGDYGGGAMMLLYGVMCAVYEVQKSGQGQVVDAAMFEGTNTLMSIFHSFVASNIWTTKRGTNFLDGTSHFYSVYETKDGKHMALAALETQFMEVFLDIVGLDKSWIANHMNPQKWPEYKIEIAKIFKSKTQVEWADIFAGTDACVTAIIDMEDAKTAPHARARDSWIDIDGLTQPAPCPRFSRTSPSVTSGPTPRGTDTDTILKALGHSEDDIAALRDNNIIA